MPLPLQMSPLRFGGQVDDRNKTGGMIPGSPGFPPPSCWKPSSQKTSEGDRHTASTAARKCHRGLDIFDPHKPSSETPVDLYSVSIFKGQRINVLYVLLAEHMRSFQKTNSPSMAFS